jgi:hypothetical protein
VKPREVVPDEVVSRGVVSREVSPREVLPHRLNRLVLILVAAAAMSVTGFLAWRVPRGEGYLPIDLRVQLRVTYGRWANLDRRFFSATYGRWLADRLLRVGAVALPLAAGAIGVRAGRLHRDPCVVVASVVSVLLPPLLTEAVLKPVIGRRLDGSLAYPSGAATTLTLTVVVVGLVAYRFGGGRRLLRGLAVFGIPSLALMVLLVSRQWHYFTDVVGGVGVGIGVPCLAWSMLVGGRRDRSRAEITRGSGSTSGSLGG